MRVNSSIATILGFLSSCAQVLSASTPCGLSTKPVSLKLEPREVFGEQTAILAPHLDFGLTAFAAEYEGNRRTLRYHFELWSGEKLTRSTEADGQILCPPFAGPLSISFRPLPDRKSPRSVEVRLAFPGTPSHLPSTYSFEVPHRGDDPLVPLYVDQPITLGDGEEAVIWAIAREWNLERGEGESVESSAKRAPWSLLLRAKVAQH